MKIEKELIQSKREIEDLRESNNEPGMVETKKEIVVDNTKIEFLEEKISDLEAQLEEKVMGSTQVQNMKKML